MFLSYIVNVSQGEAYLVRCIESLFEQGTDDIEVIVAEYQFNICQDYITRTLQERKNFKVISECPDADKLKNAAALVSEDAEFVQIVESGTAVTPHAFHHVKAVSENTDLILPGSVAHTADGFVKRFPNGWESASHADVLTAYDFCFRKSLFTKYQENLTGSPEQMESLIDLLISTGTSMEFAAQNCFYVTKPAYGMFCQEPLDIDRLEIIAENINRVKVNAVKVKLFTKYVHRLTAFLTNPDVEAKEQDRAFSILKKFGAEAKDNFVLSRIFILNTGISYEDMAAADRGGYQTLYKEIFRLTDASTSVTAITELLTEFNAQRSASEKTMHGILDGVADSYKTDSSRIEKMSNDMEALTANMHLLMTRMEKGVTVSGSVSGFSDPVNEVPMLYASGKLGLKTIVKSFNGWLRYKFSRKK